MMLDAIAQIRYVPVDNEVFGRNSRPERLYELKIRVFARFPEQAVVVKLHKKTFIFGECENLC
jgi:hypothetical protein